MKLQTMTGAKARPFLKWAGGKTQLLPTIDSFLPNTFRTQPDITYIEPFVGGGAVLFHLLQHYPNIKRAIINDINSRLINTYKVVRDKAPDLVRELKSISSEYLSLVNHEAQKEYFLGIRLRLNTGGLTDVEQASCMIFLNRICFNGLYRENSKGEFNVPFGRYTNPTICDEELILADSKLLQNVEILQGDFSRTEDYIEGYTFFYLDPPYRPLSATSSFTSYVKEAFDDDEQKRLKVFFSAMTVAGCYCLMSNSDGKSRNDIFFDELYKEFIIERVLAKRSINANAAKRGVLTELMIRNYTGCQGCG